MTDRKKTKNNSDNYIDVATASASYETIQRYGSAAKEHYVAYSGEDNELGKTFAKGLKQISEEKVNPEYEYQNIHQQAGFAAEVKSVAKSNAENIISGNPERKIRTDDLGRVNDTLADTVILDKDGNIISGTETQMKFVGASENDPTGTGDASRALDKLQSKKYQKYLDNDVKLEVPSDQYDKILSKADEKIASLEKQLENQKKAGNIEKIETIQNKIDKLKKIKKNLRKSNVSSDEAVFARLHPKLSTAKDIASISHRAGIETAKSAAVISGSVSIIKNMVSVYKGEKNLGEAATDVAKETAVHGAVGYATGFTGTAIKGFMQNSKSTVTRSLAKTNVPGVIVSVALTSGKIMKQFYNGEINGVECMEQLGQEGTGMLASAMYAAIGQAVIPIPVVGSMIGGMIGYTLSSATYGMLMQSLKEAKYAHDERLRIESECEEHIKLMRQYRKEMDQYVNTYLSESMYLFRDSFSGIKEALQISDVDMVIEYSNKITESFGKTAAFESFDDFESKMKSDFVFKI